MCDVTFLRFLGQDHLGHVSTFEITSTVRTTGLAVSVGGSVESVEEISQFALSVSTLLFISSVVRNSLSEEEVWGAVV